LRVEARPVGSEPRLDRHDAALVDADIHLRGVRAAAEAGVANDEIQAFRSFNRGEGADQ
jgi:hypothetical protein